MDNELAGKTIKQITRPSTLIYTKERNDGTTYESDYSDDNIQIEFTDGTVWKMSSWDYEGYSSGLQEAVVRARH